MTKLTLKMKSKHYMINFNYSFTIFFYILCLFELAYLI